MLAGGNLNLRDWKSYDVNEMHATCSCLPNAIVSYFEWPIHKVPYVYIFKFPLIRIYISFCGGLTNGRSPCVICCSSFTWQQNKSWFRQWSLHVMILYYSQSIGALHNPRPRCTPKGTKVIRKTTTATL